MATFINMNSSYEAELDMYISMYNIKYIDMSIRELVHVIVRLSMIFSYYFLFDIHIDDDSKKGATLQYAALRKLEEITGIFLNVEANEFGNDDIKFICDFINHRLENMAPCNLEWEDSSDSCSDFYTSANSTVAI